MSAIGDIAEETGLSNVRPRTLMDRMTRIGFLCKGVVYLLVGVLALMAALHEGGETTDQRGVMHRVAEQPFGGLALAVIAMGLFAYALWRFLCAIRDCEREGSDASGIGKRAGSNGSPK
jgi:hypothetical protein